MQRGEHHSAETRAKMSANHRSKRGYIEAFSIESRKKMSLSHMGQPAWNKGLKCGPLSDEIKAKMSAAHMGKKFSLEHRKRLSDALRGKPRPSTRREKNHNWKGGRAFDPRGYIRVKVLGHPYTTKAGEVYEHRLVAEKILGRFLDPSEIVHHVNRDKSDNRPENIMVLRTDSAHKLLDRGKKSPKESDIIFDGRTH